MSENCGDMTKKRTVEGNIMENNSFSILDHDEIAALTKNMGIELPNNDFSSINLVKEMEASRIA
jgi:hypothetical protein